MTHLILAVLVMVQAMLVAIFYGLIFERDSA